MAENINNLLLDSLSPTSREAVLSKCKPINLPLRTMLHEQGEVPAYAYFLTSGVASVVVVMAEGGSAEVGLIGCEGLVGAVYLLGPSPAPAQCFIQMDATAMRIRMDDLQTLFHNSEEIRRRILEFVQAQNVTLEQIAACNKLHEAEERLARWLLMARDREGTATMPMTQEFLALMLGTRRTTMTLVAGELQRKGMIEYTRGKVTILSREKLEAASCECYGITKRALESLYR
jgi:CRP-like cAMP-binding protein